MFPTMALPLYLDLIMLGDYSRTSNTTMPELSGGEQVIFLVRQSENDKESTNYHLHQNTIKRIQSNVGIMTTRLWVCAHCDCYSSRVSYPISRIVSLGRRRSVEAPCRNPLTCHQISVLALYHALLLGIQDAIEPTQNFVWIPLV